MQKVNPQLNQFSSVYQVPKPIYSGQNFNQNSPKYLPTVYLYQANQINYQNPSNQNYSQYNPTTTSGIFRKNSPTSSNPKTSPTKISFGQSPGSNINQGSIIPPDSNDILKSKISESVMQPLNNLIQVVSDSVLNIQSGIERINREQTSVVHSPSCFNLVIEVKQKSQYEMMWIQTRNYQSGNPNDYIVSLPLSWQQQIIVNVQMDPINENSVLSYLIDLIDNPLKLADYVDKIFARLNNPTNELNPYEFKEFLDLTASGMNAPMADSNYIMNQFNLIKRNQQNLISRLEMQDYVKRLYKAIVNFGNSCFNK